jgi:fluoride exporter
VTELLWVGLGGGAGAITRYALGLWIIQRAGLAFPYHTFVINLTGSFLIGLILVVLTDRLMADPAWRLLLVVGFLGGYTTFSSYTFEALQLLEHGEHLRAAAYLLGSNALGLLAAYLGTLLARLW